MWAAAGNRVQCLQSADGVELWTYWSEHFSIYGNLVIAQGRLLAPDIDGWTYVLDPATGELLDRLLLPRGVGLSSDGRSIFAACGVRALRAFDPASLSELWCFHRPGTYIAGRPTLRSHDLFVTSSDGNAYRMAKSDGSVLWSFQLGDVEGAIVALTGDMGLLINGDGELMAFGCPGEDAA